MRIKRRKGTWDDFQFEIAGRETARKTISSRKSEHRTDKCTTRKVVLDFPNGGFTLEKFNRALWCHKVLEKFKDGQFLKYKDNPHPSEGQAQTGALDGSQAPDREKSPMKPILFQTLPVRHMTADFLTKHFHCFPTSAYRHNRKDGFFQSVTTDTHRMPIVSRRGRIPCHTQVFIRDSVPPCAAFQGRGFAACCLEASAERGRQRVQLSISTVA